MDKFGESDFSPGFFKRTGKIYILVSLFLIILTGTRILWIVTFHNLDQPYAINGQLDLQEWDANDGRTITLDGQWEFYPHVWLMGESSIEERAQFIQVPGGWNDFVSADNSPYGYGSYRLRILVNPNDEKTYSIRIPSVRSSSELYVNGRLLSKSGQPGKTAEETIAYNIPYSASFPTNGSNVIEIVVQVANFKDPRNSGIVRSIKFGEVESITRETQFSITMQQMVAIVFLMHGVYALILFFVGHREKRLLYFSLLTISAMFINLLGSDEKLLSYWFPINYEWGFKLVHLSMVSLAYALFQCVKPQFPVSWRKFFPYYIALCGLAILLSLLLPAQYVIMLQPLYTILLSISIVLTIISMFLTSIKEIKDNTLLLLAIVAFGNNLFWWGIFLITGIKSIYYPFDLIIAIACFASFWFRGYFKIHAEANLLTKKLQRSDKLKDEFLANTSHELRNPLHGILNISKAVLEREQPTLNQNSIKDLETVLSVGRRMSLMLNDLLDTMSLKEHSQQLNLQTFSIHTIVTGVIDMLQFMTEDKPIRLINDIPVDFPKVFADENRVIQIIFNVLHNAVKYTNEGTISIHSFVKDGRAQIVISDTGVGIDEETMIRIFEPYEQAYHGNTMIEGGFGLGLSISKQLVELHGGTLQAKSVLGQGSEFSFTLQLSNDTNEQQETVNTILSSFNVAESTISMTSKQFDSISEQQPKIVENRPRVLVVDDDPINLRVIETILTVEKFDIVTVTSGKKALAILDATEWDLIISDVMMPQMSGYELTRKIRQRFTITELPILLLTARSQPQDIENGFLAGANDYVVKPVDALEIRTRAKALTEVKQSVRERLRMEAAWLQAQIQPHFFFNTLNAILALSEIDMNRMRNLLEAFSDYLRESFKFQNIDELIPIEEELNLVRSYLFIEKERFGDRLHVTWEITENIEMMLPALTIQPLVENAVRHGIMKQVQGGNIHIQVLDYVHYVEIIVTDDGVGMDESMVQRILVRQTTNKSGVGLLNTDLRLKQHYGKGLQINSKQDYGTTVSFIVLKK
ncbi:response regulator [Lysinibacillus fusiformis]|nr:response regulator [Lysinibacillus fusiformis]